MKQAIKLVLIYFVIQIVVSLVISPCALLYCYITTGTLDSNLVAEVSVTPTLLCSIIAMAIYLWRKGYLQNDGLIYSRLTTPYIVYSLLAGISTIVCIDAVLSQLQFLPNWMEAGFSIMQEQWLGIVSISLLGPILEELLFRGAITKVLLQQYNPQKAIVFSALIFGLFHINPVQVVGAFLSGLLFAWLYYHSRSIVPGVLIHILNNSFSVWSTTAYPDAQYIYQLMDAGSYWVLLAVSVGMLIVSINKLMKEQL